MLKLLTGLLPLALVLAGAPPAASDTGLPKVLVIGDSVSIGYDFPVGRLLDGIAEVSRIPENGRDSGYGLEKIDEWLGTETWDVIHFNWGLWDVRRDTGDLNIPEAEYEANLTALVQRMNQTGAELIWATTTPVPPCQTDPPRYDWDVIAYNEIAADVMDLYGIPTNDLYDSVGWLLPQLQIQPCDVHFTRRGSAHLGLAVADYIATTLQGVGTAVLNNGVDEPFLQNTIDDATHSADFLHVRDLGCPNIWPTAGRGVERCSNPVPDKTAADVVPGSSVHAMVVRDHSKVFLDGGGCGSLWVADRALATVRGGVIDHTLWAANKLPTHIESGTVNSVYSAGTSSVVISGGSVGALSATYDDSSVLVVGSNFAVDGVPVADGWLLPPTGVLTGTLASGDPIDAVFFHRGYSETGKSRDAHTGAVVVYTPEPGEPTLLLVGVAALAWISFRRGRRETTLH